MVVNVLALNMVLKRLKLGFPRDPSAFCNIAASAG